MTDEFLDMSKESYDSLRDKEHGALNNLARDKSIVFTKADKGNTVVIQNIKDYRNKINGVLLLDGKFVSLVSDPTMKREKDLQTELGKLCERVKEGKVIKPGISKQVYRRVYPCVSRAGVMYGLS